MASCPSAGCPREGGPQHTSCQGTPVGFLSWEEPAFPVPWPWEGCWPGAGKEAEALGFRPWATRFSSHSLAHRLRQQEGKKQSSGTGWSPACLCQVPSMNYSGR